MRIGLRWKLAAAITGALCLGSVASAGKKPPPGGNADPELTYVTTGKVLVLDADTSNSKAIYVNRKAMLRNPRIARDRRSVILSESVGGAPALLRRVTFQVDSGTVVVTGSEIVFQDDYLGAEEFLLDHRRLDGTRLLLVFGDDLVAPTTFFWLDLQSCAGFPCGYADLTPIARPPGYFQGPLGSLSANGRALFFMGTDPADASALLLWRLDLESDPPSLEALPLVLPTRSRTLEASRTDYSTFGPLESRLLFDVPDPAGDEDRLLRTFDTWSGEVRELLTAGQNASWSPVESRMVLTLHWHNAANHLWGTVTTIDLETGESRLIDDWGAYPDWAWAPPAP